MKAVIVVEPEVPENTGFIARLCENFEFELRIVNPEFNLEKARKTASKAQGKLREARIYNEVEKAVEDLDYIVGTKPGRGNSLNKFKPRENTSVMIGRESSGLSNNELSLCDAVVHIETGDYDSLNQSHAAGIVMHDFQTSAEKEGIGSGQKKILGELIQNEKLKNLVLRSNPTKDEFDHLLGQLKRGK